MRVFRWTLCAVALPAILLAAEPATAQVIYRQWSYFGDPYARPPAYVRPAPLPPGDIIDIMADDHRYRRIGQPQFAGHMYVVEGIDRHGRAVRSFVDAYNGRLIDVDVLAPGTRQIGPGPRIARLPETDGNPRVSPKPPRRPSDAQPSARGTQPEARPPRQAARPPAATPAAPDAALPTTTTRPSATPVVPLAREPRVVNPAEVRLPDEPDRVPPMARPGPPALVAPIPQSAVPAPAVPRAAAPQPVPSQPAPGTSQVAPAPLDDAVRRPSVPAAPDVPVAPLF
ncbi:MAG: hypothetical protein ACRCUE_08370 [Bosea sp. (in: a-proteobacteria)]